MSFRRARGRTKVMEFTKATTAIIVKGMALKLEAAPAGTTTGRVIGMDGDTTAEVFLGVAHETNTDTATAAVIRVEVPLELGVEWYFSTDSDGGLLGDSFIGQYLDVSSVTTGTAIGTRIDISSSARDDFIVTKRLSDSSGIGSFVKSIWGLKAPGAYDT